MQMLEALHCHLHHWHWIPPTFKLASFPWKFPSHHAGRWRDRSPFWCHHPKMEYLNQGTNCLGKIPSETTTTFNFKSAHQSVNVNHNFAPQKLWLFPLGDLRQRLGAVHSYHSFKQSVGHFGQYWASNLRACQRSQWIKTQSVTQCGSTSHFCSWAKMSFW